ncbi:MAG: SPOR domain-containing protein [Candidatus Cloacimonetes bacterium]|nr:SPOR domain-containing protein [Candidatus Cloacimonadota bacterium]
MEEPLETLDTIPETQDKLISLMAWLIIACLLFYLALFTFESFFKANQFSAVDREFDVSSSEMILDSSQDDAGTVVISDAGADENFMVNLEDGVLGDNVTETPLVEVTESPIVDIPDSVLEDNTDINMVVPDVVVKQTANTGVNVTESFLDAPMSTQLEVNDAVNTEVFQLKLATTFATRQEAFDAMKQMDFGDLDIQFDLVLFNDVYGVYLGSPLDQSDLAKLESYLSLRNTKAKFSILTQGDIENIDKQVQIDKAKNPAALPSVENFRTRAAMIQFTIQIGSFLREDNAQALRDSMFKKGFNSDVEVTHKGSKTLYKVLVGNYATRRKALEAATELSESDNLPVYVRTVN